MLANEGTVCRQASGEWARSGKWDQTGRDRADSSGGKSQREASLKQDQTGPAEGSSVERPEGNKRDLGNHDLGNHDWGNHDWGNHDLGSGR